MNKENCALKLVDEIILYYDARSKKTSEVYSSILHCMMAPFFKKKTLIILQYSVRYSITNMAVHTIISPLSAVKLFT